MGLNWVFLLFFWMQFEAVTMETVCAWVGGVLFSGSRSRPSAQRAGAGFRARTGTGEAQSWASSPRSHAAVAPLVGLVAHDLIHKKTQVTQVK